MDSHPAHDTAPGIARESAQLDEVDASHDASGKAAERYALLGLFAIIAALVGGDVVMDLAGGVEPGHVAFEGAIFAAAAGGFIWLWRRIRRARVLAGALTHDLARARADAAKWRQESQALLAGLGAAIDRQFAAWGLSAAEREVGLLLLKGLSLREIADARGTSERTVRQQAFGLYRKAQVAGRAELSAFFLEDLLLPQ